MERLTVSKEELLSILNEELSKHKECYNCEFHGIKKLKHTDGNGCNWSSDITLRCSGAPLDRCIPFSSRIISNVRALYNLE